MTGVFTAAILLGLFANTLMLLSGCRTFYIYHKEYDEDIERRIKNPADIIAASIVII